ncbi:putative AC transposase [Tanacetum coccineum]
MASESASASTVTGGSNTTLRNHITHPHCEAIKAQKNQNPEAGQTSMARDKSVFRHDPDYLREQFTGLVIQRALPFNHFDHEQTTRVFQNTMQPRYTHISRSTLKRDAMKLWLAAKQEIIDSFGNINACVNLTMDVWSAPHGVPGSYMYVTVHWIEPAALNPCFNVNGVDYLIESISTDLEFFDDRFASKLKGYFKESLEGFWKEKETMFPVLSRIAMDIISVQPSLVASESAFSTSGRVLSIRRTRLTPASLEMYNQKGSYTPQNPNAYQGGSVSTKHGNEANKKPNQASTRGTKKRCRRVAHRGGFGGKGDKVVWNIVINKDGDLGYQEIENDVDEVYNETASFMAAKIRLVALLRVEVVMGTRVYTNIPI